MLNISSFLRTVWSTVISFKILLPFFRTASNIVASFSSPANPSPFPRTLSRIVVTPFTSPANHSPFPEHYPVLLPLFYLL